MQQCNSAVANESSLQPALPVLLTPARALFGVVSALSVALSVECSTRDAAAQSGKLDVRAFLCSSGVVPCLLLQVCMSKLVALARSRRFAEIAIIARRLMPANRESRFVEPPPVSR